MSSYMNTTMFSSFTPPFLSIWYAWQTSACTTMITSRKPYQIRRWLENNYNRNNLVLRHQVRNKTYIQLSLADVSRTKHMDAHVLWQTESGFSVLISVSEAGTKNFGPVTDISYQIKMQSLLRVWSFNSNRDRAHVIWSSSVDKFQEFWYLSSPIMITCAITW